MARSSRVNATDQGVRVRGLNELNRSLRRIGPELQKELKATNLDVAQFVADDAKGAAYSLGGVAAKTAPSIRASARNVAAGVTVGGAAYPFAGGAEFGSIRYKQFAPWRGNGSGAGYFIYPAIRENADDIQSAYLDALDDLLQRLDLK